MPEYTANTRIGVVILDWNKPNQAQRCAESVLAEFDQLDSNIECKLVVVDNGSENAAFKSTRDWAVKIADSRISLRSNDSNYGFAKGMNSGLDSLIDFNPGYVWLLNNDLYIAPNSLLRLLELAENDSNICLVGPTVVNAGTDTVQCAGGCYYLRWLGLERPMQTGKKLSDLNKEPSKNVDYIYGASMFIRADFLKRIGGLDERYFLFYEELELALSLRAGQKMAWCPSSIVYHAGSKSEQATKASRAFTAYHAALSAFRFTWRHYPYCLPTVVLARLVGLCLHGISNRSLSLITAPWRALWSWLRQSSQ